jgi:hypothetical protein
VETGRLVIADESGSNGFGGGPFVSGHQVERVQQASHQANQLAMVGSGFGGGPFVSGHQVQRVLLEAV